MESLIADSVLIADFVQISSAIAIFFFWKGGLLLILRFSENFFISEDTQVVSQLLRQLVHSVSDDNNIVKVKKISKYLVTSCQKNFLLLPISVRMDENSKNVLRRKNIKFP